MQRNVIYQCFNFIPPVRARHSDTNNKDTQFTQLDVSQLCRLALIDATYMTLYS